MKSILCVAVLAAAAVPVGRADEKVPPDKLPGAVTAAVLKRFPAGEMVGAEKESEDGKTVYEVAVKSGGAKYDVSVTADGTLLGMEKAIAVADLPKAVAAAVAAKYPAAAVKTAEEVTKVKAGKETLAYYEVVVEAGGKKVEVEVLPDGTIKAAEDKKEEKGEKGERK